MEYSAPQIAGREEPFHSAIREHLKGHTEGLEDLAIEMLARGYRCATSRMPSRTRPAGFFCRRASLVASIRSWKVIDIETMFFELARACV